jgi:beta-alanine--pyruvate transaminase
MMSLKGKPHLADIRPIGLMCGIDLEPRAGAAGVRGYEAIERMYHEHDVHVRVTMDTLIVSPPLIATERDFGEIRDRIAAMLAALS